MLIDTTYTGGIPGLVFDAEELLKGKDESFSQLFSKFRVLDTSGSPITADIVYDGSQIKVVYRFPCSEFSVIANLADEIITYNRDKDTYSSIAREEYEKHMETSLKTYDLKIKDIINRNRI